MRIAVEPEPEILRDAPRARAMTSVGPLADQVYRESAFVDVAQGVTEIRQIIVGRENRARTRS